MAARAPASPLLVRRAALAFIEDRAETFTADKGTNLYFEEATGLLHAITSHTGGQIGNHWTTEARPYACP